MCVRASVARHDSSRCFHLYFSLPARARFTTPNPFCTDSARRTAVRRSRGQQGSALAGWQRARRQCCEQRCDASLASRGLTARTVSAYLLLRTCTCTCTSLVLALVTFQDLSALASSRGIFAQPLCPLSITSLLPFASGAACALWPVTRDAAQQSRWCLVGAAVL